MDCRTVRTLIVRKPPPDQQAAFEAHLSTCPACRDELADLPAFLAAPALPEAPADLAMRVLAQLPKESPRVLAQRAHSNRRRKLALGAFAAALGLLVLTVGLLGIFVDSTIPAQLVGGVEGALGRLLLALTIAAKPLVGLLSMAGMPALLLALVVLMAAGWLWQRLLAPAPQLVLEVVS